MENLIEKIKQAGLDYADIREYLQKSNNKREAHCYLCRALEAMVKNMNIKFKLVFPLTVYVTCLHLVLANNPGLGSFLDWIDLLTNQSI